MKKYGLKIVAAVMIIFFGTTMQVSAFGSIAASDDHPKSAHPYIAEKTTAFNVSVEQLFAHDISALYALNRSQLTDTAPLIQTDQTVSDNGLDWGRWHKYLGYGSLILAGIAAVSSSARSVHYGAAYAATGAALASCYTGQMEYGDRFHLADGLFSEDNTHILLGVLGTIGIATATAIGNSSRSSHAALGGAGTAAMMLSIITIRW